MSLIKSTSTITNNLRFPGQYFDSETGKHYNWNRYYDPKTGRYTQVDPIGFEAGDMNLYRYVRNLPTGLTDAFGLFEPNRIDPGQIDPNSMTPAIYRDAYSECQQDYNKCYNECLERFATSLLISDTLGLWGIGSAVATGISAGILKAGEKGAEVMAKKSVETFGSGSFAYIKGYDKYWKYMGTLSRLGWIAKISGYVTVGATAYSAGVRFYCWGKCH